jgi:hypothetical protein
MTRRTLYALIAIGLIAAVAALLAARFMTPDPGPAAGDPAVPIAGDFLDAHWAFPLEPQGMPPGHFEPGEASLGARACAECHVTQHEDWQTSRHSHTMNAGIRWQFHVFSQAESNKCMDCHAPLAEQKALVARELGWPNAPQTAPPGHIPPDLHDQGLTCAACHVRGHERFGPESRIGVRGDEDGLPHGGFTPRTDFSDSRFCAACHQFPEDGPRLNAKLRQDTYNEWLASDYAEQGVTCQSCHMPERRHLWRGISDPEMVRRAVAVELTGERGDDGQMDFQLEIANVGAGHHFPAYMVPRVDVRLVLLDPDGEVAGEILHHVIQWRASVDLTTEAFDTRLAAGEAVTLTAEARLPEETDGWSLALHMDVAPKEHYERVYQDMMRQADRMNAATLNLLRLAMVEAAGSRYRALEERVSLDAPVRLSVGHAPWPTATSAP